MNTTLCESCFPLPDNCEVLTIVPITPCAVCGQHHLHYGGSVRSHLYRGDPRTCIPAPAQGLLPAESGATFPPAG